MSIVVAGFVKNGVVVPNAPLPEGAKVEIRVSDAPVPAGEQKPPRTSLAEWADAHAENWGNQLSSEDVEGFTGRRF